MTRKHFAALARELRTAEPTQYGGGREARTTWETCVRAVAGVCASTNVRFDRKRFLIAAGVEPAPPKPPRVKRPSVAARTIAALGTGTCPCGCGARYDDVTPDDFMGMPHARA